MSTLNYIDENGNINKAGVIPSNYIRKVDELEDAVGKTKYKTFAVNIDTSWGNWYQCASPISIPLGGDYRGKRVEWSIISDMYDFTASASIDSTSLKINLFRPQSAKGVKGTVYVRMFD